MSLPLTAEREAAPPEWLAAPAVSEWLLRNKFSTAGVRQDGGFLFTVHALDAGAASIRTAELVDRLSARMAVGTKRELLFLGRLWIGGEPAPFPLPTKHRGVWVNAIEREDQLYNLHPSGRIDAAIELLSDLQTSSPNAAVAGGWAAIEALLSESSDRGGAAERLAMLVACSFPRAELTALSYSLPRVDSALETKLDGVTENRDRCAVIAEALTRNPQQTFETARLSDQAAVARMAKLLRNPQHVLAVIQEQSAVAFRRLYRQRNLVLHWGKTDAVALRANLRTAAPLVGAGIDRIIHAFYVDRLSPLELVARAKVALATVGFGLSCIDLLD